jgi:hypothetical protein
VFFFLFAFLLCLYLSIFICIAIFQYLLTTVIFISTVNNYVKPEPRFLCLCALLSDPRIGDVIDEDVVHSRAPFVACTQQCFAIKAGIDGLLDVARRSFCDTSEGAYRFIFISDLCNALAYILYCSHT